MLYLVGLILVVFLFFYINRKMEKDILLTKKGGGLNGFFQIRITL